MSRVDYADEEDFPGQWALQEKNLERLLAGKRGQAVLRDLEAALVAVSEKRLIADHGVKAGQVCAVTALAVHRMVTLGQAREQALRELETEEREYLGDDYDENGGDDQWTVDLGESVGVPHMMAWRLVALNDLDLDYCTPEQRYEKVLAWTRRHIQVSRGVVNEIT